MTSLLDVNVLVALLWPQHKSHTKAQEWFAQNAQMGWATCALTQTAFVRIVSNPAFSGRAISPRDALIVLSGSIDHPSHRYWTEDISVTVALSQFARRLLGHQHVTDAYLLAVAMHRRED